MKQRTVIDINGKELTLREWQKLYNLPVHKVSKCYDLTNDFFRSQTYLCEPLLIFLDRLCIKDEFRTIVEPQYIRQKEYSYCTTEGLSACVFYAGRRKKVHLYRFLAETIRECKELEPEFKVRIKFHRQFNGQLYIDVAPMYYGYARPFAYKPHHPDWEIERYNGIAFMYQIWYWQALRGVGRFDYPADESNNERTA